MANRIERIKTKATELVENKDSLNKQLSDIIVDKSTISELLATLSDDSDIGTIDTLEKTVDAIKSDTEASLSHNKEQINDTIEETDDFLNGLEDNLSKLKRIEETTDLGSVSSEESSTKKRIDELERIKELLGEESTVTDLSGATNDAEPKTAFQELSDYMFMNNYNQDDYDEYSRDPEWQKLHKAAFPEYHEKLATQNLINLSVFVKLSDSDMTSALSSAFAQAIDSNQNDTDTQRFFNAIGWSDRKPMILGNERFEQLRNKNGAITLYHTDKPSIDSEDSEIYAEQFMSKGADNCRQYICNGKHGDGTYFSNSSEGAWAYGAWKPEATQFKAFLNSNAKLISEEELDDLVEQFAVTHPETYQTLYNCKQGYGSGSTEGIKSIIAAMNGYNVILSDGFLSGNEQYFTVLDRSAVTVCDSILFYKNVDQQNPQNW